MKYVIGHKNPDTDSVCSAICYAYLKNYETGSNDYVPAMAGRLSEETNFVLEQAGVDAPVFLPDVYARVEDGNIAPVKGAPLETSVFKVCDMMREEGSEIIPILEGRKLLGIATLSDIMKQSYLLMNQENAELSNTPVKNITEVIKGKLEAGDETGVISPDRIIVGLSRADATSVNLDNSLVILNNNPERQMYAIEHGASYLILCISDNVSSEVIARANERGTVVFSTTGQAYHITRILHQATPIRNYMIPNDKVIRFKIGDTIASTREEMRKYQYTDFPVEDMEGNYVGIISKYSVADMKRREIVLVDHNEKSQAVDGIDDVIVAEIVDHHRLGSLETTMPLFFRNQPVGCTATIITQMMQERNIPIDGKIARLLASAIISDTLLFKSPTCTPEDKTICMMLADIAGIDVNDYGMQMFRAGSNLSDKNDEEILHSDYKQFTIAGVTMGIGQVNSMDLEEVMDIVVRMVEYMPEAVKTTGEDMAFLMVTDIISETSYTVFTGNKAREILADAFNIKRTKADFVALKGVVSRKKQFLPSIMEVLEK